MNPTTLLACEPIPWMLYVYMGPTVSGAMIFLSIAALAIVVAIKSSLFALMLPGGRSRAFFVMVIANVASTVLGIFHGMVFGWPALGVMIIFISSIIVGDFLAKIKLVPHAMFLSTGFLLGVVSVVLVVSSAIIMHHAQSIAHEGTLYFLTIKAGALFLALLCSIALTTGWEGIVAIRLIPDRPPGEVFLAIVKANLWTFFGIFLIGALIALPIRMSRPNFLWPYGDR